MSGGFDFSIDDGQHWFPVPSDGTLQAAMNDGLSEPPAYDLLREAVDVVVMNQRSALIIAMAALEAGLKAYISRRVPEAEWLATEVPSPPVHKMLRDYIQSLAVAHRKPFAIPPKILNVVRKAVEERNHVAHRGDEITKVDV